MEICGITGEAFWGRNMNVLLASLKRAFREIRRQFFRRWDPSEDWRIKMGSPDYSGSWILGYCARHTKTIYVKDRIIAAGGDELKSLVIHEICHAITSDTHGKTWIKCMERAAKRAKTLGLSSLADMLSQEIQDSPDVGEVKTEEMYRYIEYCVALCPDATYETILKAVSSEYGIAVDEIERRYRRSRAVYDKKAVDLMRR